MDLGPWTCAPPPRPPRRPRPPRAPGRAPARTRCTRARVSRAEPPPPSIYSWVIYGRWRRHVQHKHTRHVYFFRQSSTLHGPYEPRHTGGRLSLCSVPGRPISTRTLSVRLLPVRLALGLRLAAARPLRVLVDPLDAKGRREARAQPGPHAGAAPRLDTPPPAHPAGARRRLQHRRRGLALQVGVRAWLG